MWSYNYSDELTHHGIKGQKWGVRRFQKKDGSLTPAGKKRYDEGSSASKLNAYATRAIRGHAGPGMYVGKKRQLAGAKRDLEILDRGGHLSVGLTKKRQAAYDARDRAALEKKISKLESEKSSGKQTRTEKKVEETTNAKKVASKKQAMDSATDNYKQAEKAYKQAKKDYKNEINKENEAYAKESKKMKFIDKNVFNEATKNKINRLLNENEGMTVSQARKNTYIEAGVNTATMLLVAYGAYKLFE